MKPQVRQNYINPTRSDFVFGQNTGKHWELTAEVEFAFCGHPSDVKTTDIQSVKWRLGSSLTATDAMDCLLQFMSVQMACDDELYMGFKELHCPRAAKELGEDMGTEHWRHV